MFSYEDIFSKKNRVLFVAAHPDDVDVFFGGTISRLAKDKKEIYVLVMTNGGRGSKEKDINEGQLAETRQNEEKIALKILGVNEKSLKILVYLDGEIENSLEIIGEIAQVIRDFKPDIVCTHEPQGYYFSFRGEDLSYVNHRDHRNVGLSTLDAIYPFSRDLSFFRHQKSKPWIVKEVFLTGDGNSNAKIDITEVIEIKRSALMAHKSQFDPKTIEEIVSEFQGKGRYFETGNYLKLAW